jgi:uncharacterized membrane protein YkoI
MIKKLFGLVIIIAILAVGVFAFGSSDTTKNPNSTSTIQQQNVAAINTNSNPSNPSNNPTTTQNSQTKVSSAEAQKIADKYILQPGAAAGTPKLIKQDTKLVYIVPVIMNGKQVGEIYIDAQTGQNQGGAGGAPTK